MGPLQLLVSAELKFFANRRSKINHLGHVGLLMLHHANLIKILLESLRFHYMENNIPNLIYYSV